MADAIFRVIRDKNNSAGTLNGVQEIVFNTDDGGTDSEIIASAIAAINATGDVTFPSNYFNRVVKLGTTPINNMTAPNSFMVLADNGLEKRNIVASFTNIAHAGTAANICLDMVWVDELRMFIAGFGINQNTDLIETSPDGVTWTPRVTPTVAANASWGGFAYSPELSIIVGVDSGSAASAHAIWSTDGITWVETTDVETNADWTDCAWSPALSIFVSVAQGGSGSRVMWSKDGKNWFDGSAPTGSDWDEVIWCDDLQKFFAVSAFTSGSPGPRLISSVDGKTWIAESDIADIDYSGIAWSRELGLLVAVAYSGSKRVTTSPDGINWTLRDAADNGKAWQKVIWMPEHSSFLASSTSGTGNRLMTSRDGINWGSVASPADNSWGSLAYSARLNMVCGGAWAGTNRLMYSTELDI